MSLGRGDLEAGIRGLTQSYTKEDLYKLLFFITSTSQLDCAIDFIKGSPKMILSENETAENVPEETEPISVIEHKEETLEDITENLLKHSKDNELETGRLATKLADQYGRYTIADLCEKGELSAEDLRQIKTILDGSKKIQGKYEN